MKAILRASKLVVEEGAVFAGHVTVGPDAVKATGQRAAERLGECIPFGNLAGTATGQSGLKSPELPIEDAIEDQWRFRCSRFRIPPPATNGLPLLACIAAKASRLPARRSTIVCKFCHKSLRLEDLPIKDYQARRSVETCGVVTVEKKGQIVADRVLCGGMVIRGKVKATIRSAGPVLVGPDAEIKGDVLRAVPGGRAWGDSGRPIRDWLSRDSAGQKQLTIICLRMRIRQFFSCLSNTRLK